MKRNYSELITLPTFEERFLYLSLRSDVGLETFGNDRFLNQKFYQSKYWRDLRHHIIVRDNGCDLGVEGYEIHNKLLIHHINPITKDDLVSGKNIHDPENLITTTHETHNDIHYGKSTTTKHQIIERSPGDTNLW